MATGTLDVDADVTTGWDTAEPAGAHFSTVDEWTATTADDDDYVETTTADDIDEYGFQATPANLSQLTQVSVKVRGFLTDVSATAFIRVSLWRSGPTQVGSDVDLDGADFAAGYGTTPSTATAVFASLTLTKAQADTLSVRFQFKTA